MEERGSPGLMGGGRHPFSGGGAQVLWAGLPVGGQEEEPISDSAARSFPSPDVHAALALLKSHCRQGPALNGARTKGQRGRGRLGFAAAT